jgi:hypothetical protein
MLDIFDFRVEKMPFDFICLLNIKNSKNDFRQTKPADSKDNKTSKTGIDHVQVDGMDRHTHTHTHWHYLNLLFADLQTAWQTRGMH